VCAGKKPGFTSSVETAGPANKQNLATLALGAAAFLCNNNPCKLAWDVCIGGTMPSRWTCLAILVFWLAVNGFLFWKEVLPQLLPGQAPPITVDLIDEVRQGNAQIVWRGYFNSNEHNYRAETEVTYKEDSETFSLRSELRSILPPMKSENLRFHKLITVYHVTRNGDLLRLDMTCEKLQVGALTIPKMILSGKVENGMLRMDVRTEGLPLGAALPTLRLKPVPVPKNGSLMMPLHPVKRIRGLKAGQTWTVPLLDPFSSAFGLGRGPRTLRARVRPAPQMISFQKRNYGCLLIEYEDDETTARTYVRESDGTVLRQEYSDGEDRWALERDETEHEKNIAP
jgi:hypothetical protein